MARLLLTNDDGVDSPGIHAIATALHDAGHEVVIAAPLDERSGWSAGVGYMVDGTEFDVERREVPGRPDIETWGFTQHAMTHMTTRKPASCSALGPGARTASARGIQPRCLSRAQSRVDTASMDMAQVRKRKKISPFVAM